MSTSEGPVMLPGGLNFATIRLHVACGHWPSEGQLQMSILIGRVMVGERGQAIWARETLALGTTPIQGFSTMPIPTSFAHVWLLFMTTALYGSNKIGKFEC